MSLRLVPEVLNIWLGQSQLFSCTVMAIVTLFPIIAWAHLLRHIPEVLIHIADLRDDVGMKRVLLRYQDQGRFPRTTNRETR